MALGRTGTEEDERILGAMEGPASGGNELVPRDELFR